jgi:alkyl hydroperoxide reductase subunit AhpC
MNSPAANGNVSQYKKEHPVRGPILFDSGQVTASYARVTPSNPTVHLPQLFVIDANGKIRKQIVYETDGPALEPLALEATVEAALKPAR